MVALQRVLQRRHERLPVAGHGRYAAAVDVDVLEDENRGHSARERRRPAREVSLVRRFRRVALEERDRPAVGEELELQDIRMRKFGVPPVADERGDGVAASDGFEQDPRLEPVVLAGPRAADRAARLSLDKAVDAVPDLYRCPAPDCGFVVSWTPADGPPRLDCGRCGLVSCLCCGKPWHTGPCDTRGDMDEASRQYLRDAGVRRCDRCGSGVVKASGCDKMKCRCGYQFCYQCGTKDAKCSCTPSHHVFYDNVNERPDGPDYAAFMRRFGRRFGGGGGGGGVKRRRGPFG